MNQTAHKTDLRNSTKSELFYTFVSNIAEVESRAETIRALPRCSNVSYSNGKEKDYESGFHYYGARYYWSEMLTGWLSVDPMMDKYPGISPYSYCAWNPIRIIDPNGDTLFALNSRSQQDIRSIVEKKFRKRISFDNRGVAWTLKKQV